MDDVVISIEYYLLLLLLYFILCYFYFYFFQFFHFYFVSVLINYICSPSGETDWVFYSDFDFGYFALSSVTGLNAYTPTYFGLLDQNLRISLFSIFVLYFEQP